MDSFDKLIAIRPLLEGMGLPPQAVDQQILDIDYLLEQPVVRAYPTVKNFLLKANDLFLSWNYKSLNKRIPKLTIDSYYYNEAKEGIRAATQGEVSDFDLDTMELKVKNPDNPEIMYQHLLQTMMMHTHYEDNYNFVVDGPHIELIVATGQEDMAYESVQLGLGLGTYLNYYLLNRYFEIPIQIPDGIHDIYDLLFDLIGTDKIGLINSGNPYLLIDELRQYMDHDTLKIIYLSLDNLINERRFLLNGGQVDNNEEVLRYQELQENILAIQDLLRMALANKKQQIRSYKI